MPVSAADAQPAAAQSLSDEQILAYRKAISLETFVNDDASAQSDSARPDAEATREYANKVYRSLGRFASLSLTDKAITRILERFPDWSYQTGEIIENGTLRQTRTLQRLVDGVKGFKLPPSEDPRRKVSQDEAGITIEVPSVTGDDMRYVLRTEKQFFPTEKDNDPPVTEKNRLLGQSEYVELAKKFHLSKDVYVHEGDLFTDRETIALSLLTHFHSLESLGAALRTSGSTLSRILQPVSERAGADSYIDLMLVAMAAGVAGIEHIPQGKTEVLRGVGLETLQKYYSPDPVERTEFRNSKGGRNGNRIPRLGQQIGLEGQAARHTLVLHAVRDGLVQLPDPADIQAKLSENPAVN